MRDGFYELLLRVFVIYIFIPSAEPDESSKEKRALKH
jgi:hypothetical protein